MFGFALHAFFKMLLPMSPAEKANGFNKETANFGCFAMSHRPHSCLVESTFGFFCFYVCASEEPVSFLDFMLESFIGKCLQFSAVLV